MLAEIIKQKLTSVDIDKILFEFGAAKYEDNPKYNLYSTICHNSYGGGSRKLYYYKDRKIFHCYTECGSFDIFKLLEKVSDMDFKESIDYLCKILGIGNGNKLKGFGVVKADPCIESEEEIVIDIPTIDNPFILDIFQKQDLIEWKSEGIGQESLDKFNIRFYVHQNKIIIPHYNRNGEMVGIRGRALSQVDVDAGRKYMPLFIGKKDFSHPLRSNLYGLHISKNAIAHFKKVIIFEGEKSVLLMDTYYKNNSIAVAVCGSNFSKSQLFLLQELGIKEIIFAFDKQYNNAISEKVWEMKMKKIQSKIPEDIETTFIWDEIDGLLDYKDSPIDKGQKIFEKLLKKRKKLEI